MATKKSLQIAGHIPPVSSKVLVQARLSRALFQELQQRAAVENRSISNFLENWIDCTFQDYPMATEKKATDG